MSIKFPKVSLIIPCFNEEEVIIKSLNEIVKVSASITNYQWELVIIDDGSIDKTSELIKEFTNNKFDIHLIQFSRNFGHQNAVQAGLDYCKGVAAIIIDADLQDPPNLAEKMINKWENGFQVVYGKRVQRIAENKFKLCGTATEALKALMAYEFSYEGLHKIEACHFGENIGSSRVLLKAGLKKEAEKKEHFKKNGRFLDVIEYGLLRKDYLANK